MNSEELRAYICLTHPSQPDSYVLSDDGKKVYVLQMGVLVVLDGDDKQLDKMDPVELYNWHLPKLREWLEGIGRY